MDRLGFGNTEQLEKEVEQLTKEWYNLIGPDHHKDKDCHFFIEKQWSYGDAPKYFASHYGYLADDWVGPDRSTTKEAHQDLLDFLKLIISNYKKNDTNAN